MAAGKEELQVSVSTGHVGTGGKGRDGSSVV